MISIEQAIIACDSAICKNISKFDDSERGLLSQNILSQLRNFVEYVAMKICLINQNVNPNDFSQKKRALRILETRGDLRSLYKFHVLLQKSVSHYTLDENASERLMLKYYKNLLEFRELVKRFCNLEILQNLSEFPLDTDEDVDAYHLAIAEKIESSTPFNSAKISDENRYYIQKIKPFVINTQIYYEVTFTMALDHISKFDRVIAFTKCNILPNYSVKFALREERINVLGNNVKITVVDAWKISIRPCELSNYIHIFNSNYEIRSNNIEYKMLMDFLTQMNMDLCELVTSSDEFYEKVKFSITNKEQSNLIFSYIDASRSIIMGNLPGSNVLRYLLYKMNNRVIKSQWGTQNNSLSDLLLDYGCIPFDERPFCTALRQHNPKIYDVLECIPSKGREKEFLVKKILIETEIKGNLFTPQKELDRFDDVNSLIKEFNTSLYYTHKGREIKEIKRNYYIKEYADYCATILRKLKSFSQNGVGGYETAILNWLQNPLNKVDDPQKNVILKGLFASSKIALVYGAAGTGKSTLIGHLSRYYTNASKIYLAVTHPAVDNLKRKVSNPNAIYMTIDSYLKKQQVCTQWDLIVIDECSTVSNEQMAKVLEKSTTELLVLVGDVHQIESIRFGNWFSIAGKFLPQKCVYELTNTYRSSNSDLRLLWERVRNFEDSIHEVLEKNGMSAKLENFDFQYDSQDEMVLCLNYDGLYGINNINAFLQGKNSGVGVRIGVNSYKVGDPILFNESNRYSPLIYNNMKGRIVQLWENKDFYFFDICLEIAIDQIEARYYDFELLSTPGETTSTIRIKVSKYRSTDDDNERVEDLVPFQVAYAVSIHKAQGLEFDSVKIVISNEVDEKITHNIFYTAITRARKNLKIYWSPEVENKIIESFKPQCKMKDVALLKLLYEI